METSTLTKAFLLAFAIVAALFLGKKLVGSGHSGGAGFIKENRPAIEAALQNHLDESRTGCILEGPFDADGPGEPMIFRPDKDKYRIRRGCDKCADLAAAGILKIKKVDDKNIPTLTALGKALYKYEMDPVDYARIKPKPNDDGSPRKLYQPRFCFGKPKLDKITESLSPQNIGTNKNLSVKFTATLEDAHPSLYTPAVQAQVAALKLDVPPKPEEGKPPTYAPRIGNLVFYIGAPPEVDNSFRYGAWVNQ